MLSLRELGREEINDDHYKHYEFQCICYQCEGTFGSLNSVLLEVSGTTHATTMHNATNETETFKNLLQVQASDHKRQAIAQIIGFYVLLITNDYDCVFIL